MFGPNKTDITKPANFGSILKGVSGLSSGDIEALVKKSSSDQNKERLKAEATELVNEKSVGLYPGFGCG